MQNSNTGDQSTNSADRAKTKLRTSMENVLSLLGKLITDNVDALRKVEEKRAEVEEIKGMLEAAQRALQDESEKAAQRYGLARDLKAALESDGADVEDTIVSDNLADYQEQGN